MDVVSGFRRSLRDAAKEIGSGVLRSSGRQHQRDIVKALAKVTLHQQPELLATLSDLLKRIGNLAGERNAATHTMWATHYPSRKVTPNPWVPSRGALRAEGYEMQFAKLTEDLRDIFRELMGFHDEVSKLFPPADRL